MFTISKSLLALVFFAGALAMAADPDPVYLVQHGHYKQARAILEKKVAAEPKNAEALAELANVKLIFKDIDGATALAEKAVSMNPNSARAHAVLADCYGSKAEGDVGMFQGLRLAHSFKDEADKALALDPNNLDTLHNLVQFYLDAPGIAGGSKSKANETADKMVSINRSKGYLTKAEIAVHEKQTDGLESLYLKATEADPKSYDALVRTSNLYLTDKWRNLAKAEDFAQRGLQLERDRAQAYSLLAVIKMYRDDLAGVDEILSRAEKAVPNDLVPYYRVGRFLLGNGKDDARAERYLRKYLTQEPEGRAPSLAMGHWSLGLLLEKDGKLQEAIQELQTSVKMDPNFKPAQQDLKRMQD